MNGRERFLAAAARRPVDRIPVWLMRQAGRCLPEYLALRESHSFWELVTTPELACEVTLQPVERLDYDAAILFSDILVVLEGMGAGVEFPETGGPRMARPLDTPALIEKLEAPEPVSDFPYVTEALKLVREALPHKAVLGFGGAPFTLACYLVEGGGSRTLARTKRLAYSHPKTFLHLLDLLAEATVSHLGAQIEAGADAVQLFDTWAELLGPAEFQIWGLPAVTHIFNRLKERYPETPMTYFARGSPHLLPYLRLLGCDVVSLDWRVSLRLARELLGGELALQGNLDPTVLLGPPELVSRRVREVLELGGGQGHIFNLGHGVLPETPLASLEALMATVRGWEPAAGDEGIEGIKETGGAGER